MGVLSRLRTWVLKLSENCSGSFTDYNHLNINHLS